MKGNSGMEKIKNEQEFILNLVNVCDLLSKDETEYTRNKKEMILEKYEDKVLKLKNPALSYYFCLIGSDNKEVHKKIVIRSNNSEYNYLFAKNIDRDNFAEYAKVIIKNKDSLYAAKLLIDVIENNVSDDIINTRDNLFNVALKGKDANLIFDLVDKTIPHQINDFKYVILDEVVSDYFEIQMSKDRQETEKHKQEIIKKIKDDYLEIGHHPHPLFSNEEMEEGHESDEYKSYKKIHEKYMNIYINELNMCMKRIVALEDVTALQDLLILMGNETWSDYAHFCRNYVDIENLIKEIVKLNIASDDEKQIYNTLIDYYSKEISNIILSDTYGGYTMKNIKSLIVICECLLERESISKSVRYNIENEINKLKQLVEDEVEINKGIEKLELLLNNQN